MKSKHLTILSATAIVLLSLGGAARAAGTCSSDTLKGAYAFSAQGEIIGLLDAKGVHPFATPSILDDVAIVTFDGVSHFSRTDFGNANGVPRTPDFNSSQSGAYTVNPNCTGTMTIKYDNGVELDLKMVIGDNGKVVKALIATETVPTSLTPLDGTPCGNSCRQAVQVTFEGTKVFVSHEQHD
ncbi:hypothetical protein [Burkholderia sp. Ac-20353]|uniref:hypothetical protein n=1 Tax=Burkholderia sp. Ac-20353 TaxID=2703894 RepID=UPI00197BCF69|nr:hypothetical protein [Burkholderia sp. Ac-20353]MBN3789468.1 hypothetical protein [Burkholderia sp. Ac-20353]